MRPTQTADSPRRGWPRRALPVLPTEPIERHNDSGAGKGGRPATSAASSSWCSGLSGRGSGEPALARKRAKRVPTARPRPGGHPHHHRQRRQQQQQQQQQQQEPSQQQHNNNKTTTTTIISGSTTTSSRVCKTRAGIRKDVSVYVGSVCPIAPGRPRGRGQERSKVVERQKQ